MKLNNLREETRFLYTFGSFAYQQLASNAEDMSLW